MFKRLLCTLVTFGFLSGITFSAEKNENLYKGTLDQLRFEDTWKSGRVNVDASKGRVTILTFIPPDKREVGGLMRRLSAWETEFGDKLPSLPFTSMVRWKKRRN